MSTLYPMLIQPRYVERIWGNHHLVSALHKAAPPDQVIGESWEIYEENQVLNGAYAGRTIGELRASLGDRLTGHVDPGALFPLLTKLIDACDVLSVQVHPDDHFAQLLEHQPYGKTECWYVIQAEPDAVLTYGFKRDTGPAEYRELVQAGTLDTALHSLSVRAGDVVYIPAGTVHAIGAGIILYELQQTSDVTYRIYDWNRRDQSGKPRELHVDKAQQVLNYHRVIQGVVQPLRDEARRRSMLVAGEHFSLEMIDARDGISLSTYHSAVLLCALDAPVAVRCGDSDDPVMLPAFSSLLIPAAAERYSLQPTQEDVGTPVLAAYVPVSRAATREDLIRRGFSADQIDHFLAQFAPATDLGQPAVASARS